MITLLTKGVRSSLQRELDVFYKEVTGSDFNVRKVTKGAFTRARAKLNPTAFVELNENVNKTFYDEAPIEYGKEYVYYRQMVPGCNCPTTKA